MKKALNAWSVDKSTGFDEMFMQIKEAGFDGIELNMDAPGRSAHSLSVETTEDEAKEIRSISDKHGLPVVSISSSLYGEGGMGSNDPEKRKAIEKIMERQLFCAKILGASGILVVPGGISDTVSIKTAYANSLSTMKSCKSFINEYKIFVAVENVWNTFFTSPWDMMVFVDELDCPYIKAYFDVGNVLAFSRPEYWIEIIEKRISHIHIKDFLRSDYFNQGGKFTDLMTGSANWKAVVATLKNIGFSGYLTAEVEKRADRTYLQFYKETAEVIGKIINIE